MKFIKLFFCFLSLSILVNCSKSDEPTPTNNGFDKKSLLENVAENMITPSYANFKTKLQELKTYSDEFFLSPIEANLTAFKEAYKNTTIAWQKMAVFEGGSGTRFGPSSDIYLRRYINTFPTKPKRIESAIDTETYNLETNFVVQGLPALDYLLFKDDNPTTIINFSMDENAVKRKEFTKAVINKMIDKTETLILKWQTYKTEFINNDASGGNGSFSKLLNGFTEYYEQQIRKAKLAGPLGKFTQDVTRPQDIETLYSKNSKELLSEAHKAIIAFYQGNHFSSSQKGKSISDYLIASNKTKLNSSELLATVFADRLNDVQQKIDAINGNYHTLITDKDNSLNKVYAAFQEAIALLKVEVFSALNTSISYVDSDGD